MKSRGPRGKPREHKQLEPEELMAIARCEGTGALIDVARLLRRHYPIVKHAKTQMQRAANVRKASGAFLPDDGMPYRVRMQQLHELDARAQAMLAATPYGRIDAEIAASAQNRIDIPLVTALGPSAQPRTDAAGQD